MWTGSISGCSFFLEYFYHSGIDCCWAWLYFKKKKKKLPADCFPEITFLITFLVAPQTNLVGKWSTYIYPNLFIDLFFFHLFFFHLLFFLQFVRANDKLNIIYIWIQTLQYISILNWLTRIFGSKMSFVRFEMLWTYPFDQYKQVMWPLNYWL